MSRPLCAPVLLGCDSIVVAGTTTSGCVRATVIDAFSNNFRSIVIEDACFDRAQTSHAVSLFDMHAKYADVVPSSDVLKYVDGLADNLFYNLPSG
jgi:maleamate amidohydrolase